MNATIRTITAFAIAVSSIGFAQADEFDVAMTGDNWQQNRLLAPTTAQLVQEQQGTVVIYQGLRDVDIEAAMDEAFDRIDSMMFVDTVVTDENGDPATDPVTGEVVTESDDC